MERHKHTQNIIQANIGREHAQVRVYRRAMSAPAAAEVPNRRRHGPNAPGLCKPPAADTQRGRAARRSKLPEKTPGDVMTERARGGGGQIVQAPSRRQQDDAASSRGADAGLELDCARQSSSAASDLNAPPRGRPPGEDRITNRRADKRRPWPAQHARLLESDLLAPRRARERPQIDVK
jgi:hypothetical protein